jgi:hypothetical protein
MIKRILGRVEAAPWVHKNITTKNRPMNLGPRLLLYCTFMGFWLLCKMAPK